jgi:hypothetical protein
MVSLQRDPTNISIQNLVSDQDDQLHVFERRAVEGQKVRSKIKWMKVGDSRVNIS